MKTLAKSSLALILALSLTVAGCSTNWINIALRDLPVIVQIATEVAAIVAAAQGQGQVDPALSSNITNVSNEVKADLTLVQGLVDAYKAAKPADQPAIAAKIDASLVAVQGNLQSIEAAFHVKNAALQATVSTSLGLAITTVVAIESLVPKPAASAVRAVQPPSPKDLRNAFNATVRANGFGQFTIQ